MLKFWNYFVRIFGFRNHGNKDPCNHNIELLYFESYLDKSYDNIIRSVLFRACCSKCLKVAKYPYDNEYYGNLRYVYGCADNKTDFKSKLYVSDD